MPAKIQSFGCALACLFYASQARRVHNLKSGDDVRTLDSLAELLMALRPSVGARGSTSTLQTLADRRPAAVAPTMFEHVAVGSKIPAVELDFGFPPKKVNISELLWDKHALLVGVPSAFSPASSPTALQVAGYLSKQAELIEEGIDEVIIYSCNDAATMKAWIASQNWKELNRRVARERYTGHPRTHPEFYRGGQPRELRISFMTDPKGELAKALGAEVTDPGLLSVFGAPLCKRHAVYSENGVIKIFEVAEGPGDPAGEAAHHVTSVEHMLDRVSGDLTMGKVIAEDLLWTQEQTRWQWIDTVSVAKAEAFNTRYANHPGGYGLPTWKTNKQEEYLELLRQENATLNGSHIIDPWISPDYHWPPPEDLPDHFTALPQYHLKSMRAVLMGQQGYYSKYKTNDEEAMNVKHPWADDAWSDKDIR